MAMMGTTSGTGAHHVQGLARHVTTHFITMNLRNSAATHPLHSLSQLACVPLDVSGEAYIQSRISFYSIQKCIKT